MKAVSRRRERRGDVIELLKSQYRVQEVIDYSGLEPDGLFLEGTGAMVLDHIERVAYAAKSNRTVSYSAPASSSAMCDASAQEPTA